jgi:hypothetical protein
MSPRGGAGVTVGLLALFVSGCTQMSIRVDILNSAYWASPAYVDSVTIAKIADMAASIRDGRFAQTREELRQGVRRTLVLMSQEKPPQIDFSQIDTVAGNIDRTIDQTFDRARDDFSTAFVGLQKPDLAAAKAAYAKGSEGVMTLPMRLAVGLRRTLPRESTPAVNEFEQKATADAAGLIGNAGILNDPRAGAVIYAPGEHWTGVFNQTFCQGSFGNTDCAVKMEGLGNFTLKGVRLDATRITQATFSMTKEIIQAAAAVYGVPVPRTTPAATNGTTTTGTAATDQSAGMDFDSPLKRQRDAQTAIQPLRLARLAMLETIAAQRDAIRGTDAARTQAIKTIKAVLEANRKQLDPPQAQ